MRPRLISRGNTFKTDKGSHLLIASMRPRLISRGNGGKRGRARRVQDRFNEAATDQSRKFGRVAGVTSSVEASMRPRLISRGNVSLGSNVAALLPASMRPRLISRGNTGFQPYHDVIAGVLQ